MALIVFWCGSAAWGWGRVQGWSVFQSSRTQNRSKSWTQPAGAATSLAQKESAPPSNLSVTFLFLLPSPSPPTSFPFHGATSARRGGGLEGGGVLRCAAHKGKESASETAVQISLYLLPPVVKTLSVVIQQLMAVSFQQHQGVTLESESTSTRVLPGLRPDGRACQRCSVKHLRSRNLHRSCALPLSQSAVCCFSSPALGTGRAGRWGWLRRILGIHLVLGS